MLERLPQLGSNGISQDYANQVARLAMVYQLDGWPGVAAALREFPCQPYEEAYPPARYTDVVTGANKDMVARINAGIAAINALAAHGDWTVAIRREFRDRYLEILLLVYGHAESYCPFPRD